MSRPGGGRRATGPTERGAAARGAAARGAAARGAAAAGPRASGRRTAVPVGPVAAGIPRRLLALVLDWLVAVAISAGFLNYDPTATLAVFFVMTTLLIGTAGSTIGHRVAGIGVRTVEGADLPGPLRAAARTFALCLVIPAVIWGQDGRGLHDRLAGTQIVRLP